MRTKICGMLVICVLPVGFLGCEREASFVNDVQPIFREHCIECHGETGEVIAQKTAPEIQMPPHHQQSLATGFGDALPENKVDIIRAWIDQGAKNN